jgi:hypothetical protein
LRQPVLYAEQWWLRQRFFAFFLMGAGVVASAYLSWQLKSKFLTGSNVVWLLYVPTGALMLAVLLYYRWKSRIEIRDEGLHVSGLLKSVTIGWDVVRSARAQPLEPHFAGARKRYITPMVRPLLGQPALFVRLKASDAQLDYIKDRVGPRIIDGDTLAFPVPDPDQAAWEISSRLPEKPGGGTNLGGGRRRGRRRR